MAKAKAFAKSLNSNVGDDTDHSENNGDDSLSNRGVENVDDSISLRNLVEVIEGCMNAMLHQSCSTCDRDVRIKSNIFDCRTLMNAIRCAASPQYIDNNINENSNATCGDFGDTSDPLLMNRISNENRQKKFKGVREIVCYGIGNFDDSSSSRNNQTSSQSSSRSRTHFYSVPVIQLACVLLLRQEFALDQAIKPSSLTSPTNDPHYCPEGSTVPSNANVCQPQSNSSSPIAEKDQYSTRSSPNQSSENEKNICYGCVTSAITNIVSSS